MQAFRAVRPRSKDVDDHGLYLPTSKLGEFAGRVCLPASRSHSDPANLYFFASRMNGHVKYQPLLLDTLSIATLKSEQYRSFIFASVIEPGIRLLLHRHRRKMDWSYVDTKFNPNTGRDLPLKDYGRIYSWILGRGTEALSAHLKVFKDLELPEVERLEAEEIFRLLIANMSGAMMEISVRHAGRFPFRMDRDFRVVAPDTVPNPLECGAGDIFCGKALLQSEDTSMRAAGAEILLAAAGKIRAGKIKLEPPSTFPHLSGQGMHMLFQGVPALLSGDRDRRSFRKELFGLAMEFLEFVLEFHYDDQTGIFSEYIESKTHLPTEILDPGHCNELVGLGLLAIETIEKSDTNLEPSRKSFFARAKRELPRMLLKSTALGFNPVRQGIFKMVNTRTGEPTNTNMPWWNLPETMRAALRAFKVAEDVKTGNECLEVMRKCHNAYFGHYLNPYLMLFPYQTRNGENGQVTDVAPAVPEGDPLYHSNLCFLDILKMVETL